MKLFLISDRDRWGHSNNIVRAETIEQAHAMAHTSRKSEVIELTADGDAAILWCEDESPDTNDRD